jgi:hypothetical protein
LSFIMRQGQSSFRPDPDVLRATLVGLSLAGLLVVAIWFGSRRFRDFDTALVSYAGASVFAAFGVGYRYSMWLRRPPTRLYWRRGVGLFFRPGLLASNVVRLARLVVDELILQRFIEHRSPSRWIAHLCIFSGCVLAALVTFPLSFGWVRFETPHDSQKLYDAYVFGFRVFSFALDGWIAPLVFNALNIAAVLVLAGVFIALHRRARDRGALAVQRFANDLLPLALLFAVSITGLFLTASTHFLHGFQYGFLAQLHAVTVILTLLSLPFGKFFHIFQRPAQLGVGFYKDAGAAGEQATCARCGAAYASRLHVEDLKTVEKELGIRYELRHAGQTSW